MREPYKMKYKIIKLLLKQITLITSLKFIYLIKISRQHPLIFFLDLRMINTLFNHNVLLNANEFMHSI